MSEESKYQAHPAARAFSWMEGKALEDLVADIKAKGMFYPVILAKHEDEWCVLDGRNRERAALMAGVEPTYEHYEGDDPYGYVDSVNHHRRHQNVDQRLISAAKLERARSGDNQWSRQLAGPTAAQVAEKEGSSVRQVQRSRAVVDNAEPEVVEAVASGDLPMYRADEIARLEREQQLDALNEAKNTEAPRTKEKRDSMMSVSLLLKESDIMCLRALVEAGEWFAEREPRAREGVKVLLKLAPQVNRER